MKNILKLILGIITISNLNISAATKTWSTVASTTAWATASNWSPSGVPGSADDVIIGTATNQPRITSSNGNCKTITFNSSGTLLISAGKTLNVYGASFTNNSGNADILYPGGLGAATVAFLNTGGGSNCTIGGNTNTNFGSITVNKSGSNNTVTFSSAATYTIKDVLKITAGNVVTTSTTVTLLASYDISTGWNTAYIDGNGAGVISSGEITVQQVLGDYDLGKKAYHFVTSPVHISGTPDYWTTSMLDDNTDQTDVYNSSFSMYNGYGGTIPDWIYYDEPSFAWVGLVPYSMSGWKGANPLYGSSNTTDALVMQGAVGRFKTYDDGTHCLPVDWTGIANNGTISTPNLKYTNNSQFGLDGINLVGNPYPSPLDWNSVWNRIEANAGGYNHVSPIINIWQNDGGEFTGTFQYYNASDLSGDFDGIIAIGQGFYTLVDLDTTFEVENADRVANTNANFYRESLKPMSLKMKLAGEGNNDITSIYLGNYFSGYKKNEDAVKIMNFGNSIYSKASNSNIALNYQPKPDTKTIIPFGLNIENEGIFTLSSEKFNIDRSLYNCIFEDRKENKFIDFDSDFSYTFNAKQGINENRFFIHIIATSFEDNTLSKTTSLSSFYANNNIIVQMQNKTNQNVQVQITNLSGQIVYSNNFANMSNTLNIDASTFAKGIYTLSLINNDGSRQSQKIAVSN